MHNSNIKHRYLLVLNYDILNKMCYFANNTKIHLTNMSKSILIVVAKGYKLLNFPYKHQRNKDLKGIPPSQLPIYYPK